MPPQSFPASPENDNRRRAFGSWNIAGLLLPVGYLAVFGAGATVRAQSDTPAAKPVPVAAPTPTSLGNDAGAGLAPLNLNVSAVPVARKVPHETPLHGEILQDPYFWMREKGKPEVVAHLKAEEAYTEAVLAPLKPLRDKLYAEMIGRIKQTDLDVPYKNGAYYYYTRTEEGKSYPYVCRKKGDLSAPEEVILDVNALAKGEKYLGLGGVDISDDGNLLAFSTDTTGYRQYTLRIKDLRTNAVLPDVIKNVTGSEWCADNKTVVYAVEDAAKRSYRIYRHVLGDAAADELIYEEKDELYRLYPTRSKDRKYLFLVSASAETSEVRVIPTAKPTEKPRVILPRKENVEYSVEHHDGLWYIRTNEDAKNFRLVTAPVDAPGKDQWKTVLPQRSDVTFEDITTFAKFAVVQERYDAEAQSRLRIYDYASGKFEPIAFDEPIYGVFLSANPEYDTPKIRMQYTSMITPRTVMEYDVAAKTKTVLKQDEIVGGYDKTRYRTERIYVTARDGVRVPVSLVYRAEVARDGKAPLFLNAYGSYGATIPVMFSSGRISLLDRGVVYAWAHIRGGGDCGETWHDQGKMATKNNTFTDFVDVADALVAQKYGDRQRMTISGGSAGGLLVGAALNLRPDLCKAAVLEVPFVDVINTMLDESLPLTIQEFLEWGNPKKRPEYQVIRSYCPYTNIRAANYPAVLVRVSYNDSQVPYWEGAKYAARLRTTRTDGAQGVTLLKVNMDAGHGGSSGRYDALKEVAYSYAFMLHQVGAVDLLPGAAAPVQTTPASPVKAKVDAAEKSR